MVVTDTIVIPPAPILPERINIGFGGAGVWPADGGPIGPFSIFLQWDTAPTPGSLLIAVPVTPNANNYPGGYGPCTGWNTLAGSDGGDTVCLTRIADGTSADSNLDFTTSMNTPTYYWVETCMVACWEIKAGTFDPTTPIALWARGFENSTYTEYPLPYSPLTVMDAIVPQLVLWALQGSEETTYYNLMNVEDWFVRATIPWVNYVPAAVGVGFFYPKGVTSSGGYQMWMGEAPRYPPLAEVIGGYALDNWEGQRVSVQLVVNGSAPRVGIAVG